MDAMRVPSLIACLILGAALSLVTVVAETVAIAEMGSVPGSEHLFDLQMRVAGKAGFAAFPAQFSGERPEKILDPEGFTVHLVDADNPDRQRVEPAGELFIPQPGRYRIFLEGEWSITPFSTLRVFQGRWPEKHVSIRALPVVPAGRVTVAEQVADQEELELRLLYAEEVEGPLRHELSRRQPLSAVKRGVVMPEGAVIAALWDPRHQRYAFLSKSFQVRAGQEVEAPLTRPSRNKSFLVVNVYRPPGATIDWLPGLELTVAQRGRERHADATVWTAWGGYSIWYDLTPGPAVLSGGSEWLYMESITVELVGGRISRIEKELSKRLFLQVPDDN